MLSKESFGLELQSLRKILFLRLTFNCHVAKILLELLPWSWDLKAGHLFQVGTYYFFNIFS